MEQQGSGRYSFTFACVLWALSLSALAQESEVDDTASTKIDWFAEIFKGGTTSIVLLLLVAVMITFAVERFLRLKRKFIAPSGLAEEVAPLYHQRAYDDIQAACAAQPSALARMVNFIVTHRYASADAIMQGADDIGSRVLRGELQKISVFAVIAGVAPLLGLLGTIIGMIEAFKLVEVYGDDGGASMLAGSISKALVTTALGLIIAIPALGLYHFFKWRIQGLGRLLEEEITHVTNTWLLTPREDALEEA